MAFVLTPAQAAQELLACLVLGAGAGAARSLFPVRGRGALAPDFLLVGVLLALLQSFAASWSFAGALRWYMLLGGAVGCGVVCAVLGPVERAVLRGVAVVLLAPARALVRWVLAPAAHALHRRRAQAKARRQAKRTAKKTKNTLQNQPRLLYNSNETHEAP